MKTREPWVKCSILIFVPRSLLQLISEVSAPVNSIWNQPPGIYMQKESSQAVCVPVAT